MEFDILFEQRVIVADKLKKCIRDFGYTKVSFSKKADISRPTLDKILNGTLDNKCTYDKHMQKILFALELGVDELVYYYSKEEKYVDVFYSENAPKNYVMSEKAQKQYDLLMDILDLCDIYY